jgi:hypothetical protein
MPRRDHFLSARLRQPVGKLSKSALVSGVSKTLEEESCPRFRAGEYQTLQASGQPPILGASDFFLPWQVVTKGACSLLRNPLMLPNRNPRFKLFEKV